MRNVSVLAAGLVLCAVASASADPEATTASGYFNAGTARVDITPTNAVVLAGSPSPQQTASVATRLYVRALVLSAAGPTLAMVTLDTLKYPVEYSIRARQQIEQATGIPAANVIICSSHTHSGPLWSYYQDQLVTSIAEAVAQAARDLTPCRLGTSKGKADGVSECRRVIKDGRAWNRWQLKASEAGKYPPEGHIDPELDVLALIAPDGRYKAIVYNFACHAANEAPAGWNFHVRHFQGWAGYNTRRVPLALLASSGRNRSPYFLLRT